MVNFKTYLIVVLIPLILGIVVGMVAYKKMTFLNGEIPNYKSREDLEKRMYYMCEQSYFEGQKDAINGIVRIKMNIDSVYVWTTSCWDNGRKPVYNPNYIDSQN